MASSAVASVALVGAVGNARAADDKWFVLGETTIKAIDPGASKDDTLTDVGTVKQGDKTAAKDAPEMKGRLNGPVRLGLGLVALLARCSSLDPLFEPRPIRRHTGSARSRTSTV